MRVLIGLVVTGLLSACAGPRVAEQIDQGWYLRADFTYWEANPAFAFSLNQEASIMQLKNKVIYDGNPYQLVIADKGWSADKNCGYNSAKDRVITLNQWVNLQCHYDKATYIDTPIQRPFEFKPKHTGEYLFEVKLVNGAPAQLRISAIQSKLSTSAQSVNRLF
jgi:hypothetical protein